MPFVGFEGTYGSVRFLIYLSQSHRQSGSFRGRISWSLMLTVYLRVRT